MNKYKLVAIYADGKNFPIAEIENVIDISFKPYYKIEPNIVGFDGKYHDLVVSTKYVDHKFKTVVDKIFVVEEVDNEQELHK